MLRRLQNSIAPRLQAEMLRPDLGRACRSTVALVVPLVLAAYGRLPLPVAFVSIAAHSMGNVDIRGPYTLRLSFLLVMAAVMTGATWLGGAANGHLGPALLATALMAANVGLWRHLTPEYGPSLATPTALMFLIALLSRHGPGAAAPLGVLAGAGWALAVHLALWPIRPQHPLRRAVADSWLAAAALFDALAERANGAEDGGARPVLQRPEAELRQALDATAAALAAAATRRRPPAAADLGALHDAAARLAMRVGALHTAVEPLAARPAAAAVWPAYQAAAESLANVARGVALAVVSRQPAHLAACEVRMRRAASLLRAMARHAAAAAAAAAAPGPRQVAGLLDLAEAQLRETARALRAVTERADERAVFPLELLDLRTWRLRPLAAVLNLRARVDPILWRFTARLAALLVIGVLAVRLVPLPHAYWLPFTMVIVSQPDYGATRRKALERCGGTLAGVVLGIALLFLRLPLGAILAAVAVTGFLFGYFLKRRYGVAVLFVTPMVVLLTEMSAKVDLAFAAERVASTAAGGTMALLAALWFWPDWERRRHPAVLADALRANRDYLLAVGARLSAGGRYDAADVRAKRRAEKANADAFASLGRVFADPASRRAGVEQAAVLVNGNQRLTRLFNLLLLQASPGESPAGPAEFRPFIHAAGEVLDALAGAARQLVEGYATGQAFEPPVAIPALPALPDGASARTQYERQLVACLARVAAELDAMVASLPQRETIANNANGLHAPTNAG